ncbi:MAG TPA: protein kinase [Bryobacteraceae bacterium]
MTTPAHIAHYRIGSKLGEGGMGAVYRATDTKLNREVAVKVLPDSFAGDRDRLARFTREAQVLAALNHPNVAAIYGVEERALVMEMVEGPTLAERIAAGPIPMDEALPIARQIAEALEYAHERGVIHRDLKPANIKVTPEGKVKVLDFGLAKALTSETAAADPMSSPTLTMGATKAGVIMGTAAYMSPEQARGQNVDRRADIWAFGVVLYEMLTGRLLFAGPTISDTLAAVLKTDVDFAALPAEIRPIAERCLRKDVRRRWQAIGDVRVALEDGMPGAQAVEVRHARIPWAIAAVLFVLAAVLAFLRFHETAPDARVIRTYIAPPDGTTFNFTASLASAGPVAISPDGRQFTFSATSADGKNQLWVRSLDRLSAQPLAGTEEAIHPFWSPDSKSIAFFAGGKLKRVDASGGPPLTLCDAPVGRGGTWNEAGVILFAPSGTSVLQRVSASGGIPATVALDIPGRWPWFLPDGRRFLYSTSTSVRLGALDSKETKLVVETLSDAAYSQGYLIYLRDDTLMAQAFDLARLATSGDPQPLTQRVISVGSQRRGIFSVSRNGMLAYQTGHQGGRTLLTWFDRAGKRLGTVGEAADLAGVELSPDRKTVLSSVLDPVSRTFDFWRFDVAKGLRTRFTFDESRVINMAIWSPDGASVVFNSHRNGKFGLYRKAANLTGSEELLYADVVTVNPASWSPDGKTILFAGGGIGTFALPLEGERKPFPVLQTARVPFGARFSPNGRWIAYVSAESQRQEVYVAPFPGPAGKVQISSAGGTQPRWGSRGNEIFYSGLDNRLMAVEVRAAGASLEVGRAQPLFGGVQLQVSVPYDVSLDGQRFLVAAPTEQSAPEPLTLVQNWTTGLKK